MKLRVLHVIYDDVRNPWVGGGGAVRVAELYHRLGERVYATIASGRFPGATDHSEGSTRYLHLGAERPYWWSRASFGMAARKMLIDADYDVAVFDFSAYTPILIPRGRPIGITVHHLTGPSARQRWGRVIGSGISLFERSMLARAARFSATSTATADLLRERLPAIPIDMVYAGVPDDLFELDRQPEDYLLYFGRLDIFQKGLDTLLEAMALLRRRGREVELRIAGRGKDAAQVTAAVRDLGLEDSVTLLGAVTEDKRRALYSGAVMQLMPSRFEGFGMVAAEAMAAGVPLIASAAGSLVEVVDAPRGGILVPPNDPEALASAVEKLLDDPATRETLALTARLSAQRFRWSYVAEAHYDFLKRIADGASAQQTN